MTTPEPDTELVTPRTGLYLAMLSVHGLIRGHDLELGRDADTGGQTKYVVELARALAQRPEVDAVDLITRRIDDPNVDDSYDEALEDLGDGARIVRLRFGGHRYRRKEALWPYLDELVVAALRFFREQDRTPDLLHGHYADASDVAHELAARLGRPLVVTGHSLGRNKREVFANAGLDDEVMEARYRLHHRIAVEERLLRDADLVIASTSHEVEHGYELYEASKRATFEVLAPGIDVDRFYPYYYDLDETFDPGEDVRRARVRMQREISRFLNRPEKPLVLAISRPDRRKNIEGLVTAFGEDPELQQMANLAIFAGVRSDIREMSDNEREVLTELLLLMDRYDLYGKLALPKRHEPDVDIPVLYRMAAASGGVFINPALVENFGITLIEAASSGLPIVSTGHGGPKDIVGATDAGVLVDARDAGEIQQALRSLLVDREAWERHSRGGVEGVRRTFAWAAHAERYLKAVAPLLARTPEAPWRADVASVLGGDRAWLVSDVDHTLVDDEADGDPEGLVALANDLERHRIVFGLATGRSLELLERALADHDVPGPAFVITDVGTRIDYARHDGVGEGPRWIEERTWGSHIRHGWDGPAVADVLEGVDGLRPQPDDHRTDVKLSYHADDALAIEERVVDALRQAGLKANVIASRGTLLDVLPKRASKALAIRFLARMWGLPSERIAVAGDSGNDREMLTGPFRAIVVGNHAPELDDLRGRRGVFVAQGAYASGVREGLRHWRFTKDDAATPSD